MNLNQRAKVFKALSDANRLQIVEYLRDGEERTGKEIAEATQITLALLCHHTSTLEEAGLVIKRKQGQSCYHRLDSDALEGCLDTLITQPAAGQ